MTNTIGLKELRPELPKVIEDIDEKLDRYVITKRGKPVAMIMSIDDYDSLMETLDILTDRETMKRVKQGETEIRKGKTLPWKKVKRNIG